MADKDPFSDLIPYTGSASDSKYQQLPGTEVVKDKDDPYKELVPYNFNEKGNKEENEPDYMDWIKSFGTGALTKGVVTNTLGFPGDIERAAKGGAGWLMDKGGTSEETKNNVVGTQNAFPSSQDILDSIQKYAPNLVHAPHTEGGKALENIGQFVAPSMAGKGSMAKNLVSGLMAGTGSEAAAQYAKGTPYEGVARIGGAFAGGHGVSKATDAFTHARPETRAGIMGIVAGTPALLHGDLMHAAERATYGTLGGGALNVAIDNPFLQQIARHAYPNSAADREAMTRTLIGASPSIAAGTKTPEKPYEGIYVDH